MGQIKEDLQLKQALRDAELKKRGWRPSCSFSLRMQAKLIFLSFWLLIGDQKRSKTRRRKRRSRLRSKPTNENVQRKRLAKRLYARASLRLTLSWDRRRLRLEGVVAPSTSVPAPLRARRARISRRQGCRSGWRVASRSHTPLPCQAMPVRHLPLSTCLLLQHSDHFHSPTRSRRVPGSADVISRRGDRHPHSAFSEVVLPCCFFDIYALTDVKCHVTPAPLRKAFTKQDFSRTLRELGLTPSAVREHCSLPRGLLIAGSIHRAGTHCIVRLHSGTPLD